MTVKELAIPITLAISIGGSAVLIANSNGRQAQALLTVQSTLTEIRSDLKENEQNYRSTIKTLADLNARLQVLEKAADTQNGINIRVLGHLERKGD